MCAVPPPLCHLPLGTNRPAHYNVLVDENGFGADALQLFTWWLTFTYQRATRSVSVAPPAYYAHLAAFRCAQQCRDQHQIHNIKPSDP